jgi:aryl-alcohol dehydrogenase-like predicted oxidoreductase
MAEAPGPFVLGCVQLGLAYGVANRTGMPGEQASMEILDAAREAGVRELDTARGYGVSEQRIGAWLTARDIRDIRIVTKLDPACDPNDAAAVRASLEASTGALGRRPDIVMLHDPKWIAGWNGRIADTFRSALDDGLTGDFGVSVYGPDEAAAAIAIPEITAIQAPASALDRRFAGGVVSDGWPGTLYLRSVFLQGLLTMNPETLPARLAHAAEALRGWRRVCADFALEPAAAAISWARAALPGARIVLGCETVDQVRANAELFTAPAASRTFLDAVAALPPASAEVVDPRKWAAA